MTSSAVSAIDFGNANMQKANQPKDFYEMLYTVGGDGNLGNCWVSAKCNLASPPALHQKINPFDQRLSTARVIGSLDIPIHPKSYESARVLFYGFEGSRNRWRFS
mgnify:FL=1